MLSLAEVIKRNILSQTITGALFFDFSDAFGSVNRTKLLYKLRSNYGISGRLFLYLVSFLSSRKARVTVNTLVVGDWIESEYGTSAGTILGALLFIAYVQDTPICIRPKFADDLVGFTSGKDVATVEESLQCILNELSAWSAEWDMQLNITKTKVVLFGTQQGKVNLVLTVIEQVDCIKYLGVWLDSHVSFMQQAEYAASKATKAAWKINRLIDGRKGLTPKTGIALYKCLIRPCWEFSVAAWATMQEKGIKLLEQVQERCLRAIFGAKAHAAADAIDVIANVTPVRLRIEQLCTLEYVRILSKPQQSCLRALLQDATLLQSGFTPMRYLYFQSKTVHKAMEDLSVELEHTIQAAEILNDSRIEYIDIVHNNDCGNVTSVQGKVDEFIRLHQHDCVGNCLYGWRCYREWKGQLCICIQVSPT